MTRHRRLQKSLRHPARRARTRRNRRHRLARRELLAAFREMFRDDRRLVPPAWLWDEIYGSAPLRVW